MIGGIITGVFFNMGQDIYDFGKQAIIHSVTLQIIIPVVLGITGLGIILYDFWSRRRGNKTKASGQSEQQRPPEIHDEDLNPKAKSERRWRFFPANYR